MFRSPALEHSLTSYPRSESDHLSVLLQWHLSACGLCAVQYWVVAVAAFVRHSIGWWRLRSLCRVWLLPGPLRVLCAVDKGGVFTVEGSDDEA